MLEQVCRLVPAAYKNQCEAFIELYSKKLIELLLSKSSPHTICTVLHLCKGMETASTGKGNMKNPIIIIIIIKSLYKNGRHVHK